MIPHGAQKCFLDALWKSDDPFTSLRGGRHHALHKSKPTPTCSGAGDTSHPPQPVPRLPPPHPQPPMPLPRSANTTSLIAAAPNYAYLHSPLQKFLSGRIVCRTSPAPSPTIWHLVRTTSPSTSIPHSQN